jgi:hypothetical protein
MIAVWEHLEQLRDRQWTGGVVKGPIDDINATIDSLTDTTAICIGDKST